VYYNVGFISMESWGRFWHFYVWMAVVLCTITTVWFTIGGVIDMQKMFKRLSTLVRDDSDDGEIHNTDNDKEVAE